MVLVCVGANVCSVKASLSYFFIFVDDVHVTASSGCSILFTFPLIELLDSATPIRLAI